VTAKQISGRVHREIHMSEPRRLRYGRERSARPLSRGEMKRTGSIGDKIRLESVSPYLDRQFLDLSLMQQGDRVRCLPTLRPSARWSKACRASHTGTIFASNASR
jgi:hypothetical protein